MVREVERSTGLGLGLVGLALLAVLAVYPPPTLGGGLAVRAGMFVALGVAAIALALALVGGVRVGRGLAGARPSREGRLVASALGPAAAAALVGGYLTTVAGFDPGWSVAVVGLVVAGLVGVAVELLA